MKRLVGLAAAAALAVGAWLVPAPDAAEVPTRFGTAAADLAVTFAGVWYCPVASATVERETLLSVATAERSAVAFTFPNPVPGEEPDRARFALGDSRSATIELSEVALRGDAPGFVEFTTRSAAAFVTVADEGSLAAGGCLSSAPKVWYLPGASTQQGELLRLRLFNPFPEPARVNVLALSEFEIEPLPQLEAVTVAARSWEDFDLEETLRLRDVLGFTIRNEEGLAFPAIIVGNGEDIATWSGTSLHPTWEFPVTRLGGLAPELVLLNPGSSDLVVTLDFYLPDGPVAEPRTVDLPAQRPLVVPIGDVTDGPFGVRVDSSGAIAASVLASGGAGLAGTLGVPTPAGRWLVPGAEAGADGLVSIWLLNTSTEAATVTAQPLVADAVASKVLVEPGTVRQILAEAGASGVLVDSTLPITVGWSVETQGGAAFGAGISTER